jgi:hypothetical protein
MDRVRLGFQRFALYLYSTDRISPNVDAIYDREFHPPGQAASSKHLNEPKRPPLNAVLGKRSLDSLEANGGPDPPA